MEQKIDPSEVVELFNLLRGLLRRVEVLEVHTGLKNSKPPPCPYCDGDGAHKDFCHLKGRK